MSRLTSNAKQLTETELSFQSDQCDVKNNYSALHTVSVPDNTCLDVYDNVTVSF